ncbi:MAG: GNAT family N-acetyltransferase [Hyphomicrobiaceae bacterium]|nr:GNAT family N-acetyltransferase [Hyphomicrobiaceae bacterium]
MASQTPLTQDDEARLAVLHRQALPSSIVSRLGVSYARSFYRYIVTSPHERLAVLRDAHGLIEAAAVVSDAPGNLQSRLVVRTPLLLFAVARFWHLPLRQLVFGFVAPHDAPALPRKPELPELILVFVAPEARSRGAGARLIQACEQRLRAAGHQRYTVKTLDDPGNRALAFYAREGFSRTGVSHHLGEKFVVFEKAL